MSLLEKAVAGIKGISSNNGKAVEYLMNYDLRNYFGDIWSFLKVNINSIDHRFRKNNPPL